MQRLRRQPGGRTTWLLALLASALLACSSQVESDYRGEPIATMHGVVAASAELDVPDVSAAIVWVHADRQPRLVGERIDVTDSFPASFTLNLYTPPPVEAEVSDTQDNCVFGSDFTGKHSLQPGESCEGEIVPAGTGLGLWIGYLAAIRADAPDGEISRSDIVGIDVDHVLVYYTRASDDPLPPMPSLKDKAAHAELATFGNADAEHAAGYTLLKENAEFQAIRAVDRECKWRERCVRWQALPGEQHDFFDELYEWELQRCLQRFPENPTCTARSVAAYEGWAAVGPEEASSIECRELFDAETADCGTQTELLPYTDLVGDGLDDPITIQLGLGLWDAAEIL